MLYAVPRAVPRVCCVRDGAEQGQTARKTQMHVCTLCGRFLKREDWQLCSFGIRWEREYHQP